MQKLDTCTLDATIRYLQFQIQLNRYLQFPMQQLATCYVFACPEVHGKQHDNDNKVNNEATAEEATQEIRNDGENSENQMKKDSNVVPTRTELSND